jgi:hypothetical protein
VCGLRGRRKSPRRNTPAAPDNLHHSRPGQSVRERFGYRPGVIRIPIPDTRFQSFRDPPDIVGILPWAASPPIRASGLPYLRSRAFAGAVTHAVDLPSFDRLPFRAKTFSPKWTTYEAGIILYGEDYPARPTPTNGFRHPARTVFFSLRSPQRLQDGKLRLCLIILDGRTPPACSSPFRVRGRKSLLGRICPNKRIRRHP